jgi:hypothetical protein
VDVCAPKPTTKKDVSKTRKVVSNTCEKKRNEGRRPPEEKGYEGLRSVRFRVFCFRRVAFALEFVGCCGLSAALDEYVPLLFTLAIFFIQEWYRFNIP